MVTPEKSLRAITLISLGVLLLGCQEQRPSVNTPEYLAAHGVAARQPTLIKVGGENFYIPADVQMQVETSGEIVKGQADYVRIFLNDFFPPQMSSASIPGSSNAELLLRIDIRRSPGTQDGREDLRQKRPWSSIREIPEWQLREFQDKRPGRGGWGVYSYESLHGAPKTPFNEPIQFVCTGAYPSHSECWGGYRFNPQIQIWYFFPAMWLPIWQKVHEHVLLTVERYHQPTQR